MQAAEWSKNKPLIIHVRQRSLRGAKSTLDYPYSAARLQRLAGAFVHGLYGRTGTWRATMPLIGEHTVNPVDVRLSLVVTTLL